MHILRRLPPQAATAAIGILAAFQAVAATQEINSAALKVQLDTAFPRVVDYQLESQRGHARRAE